jgi:4-hydroxy-tetrahydrodipicolinate synthase
MLDRDREALIRVAVKAAAGLPVIVGTSHSGTQAALGLSRMAQELGARAVMVTPHAEAVPSEESVLEYYRVIASGIRIPIVLQDHPASSGVYMSAPLMLRIVAELPLIAAMKEEALPTAPKIRTLIQGMSVRKVPILTGLGALYGQFDLEAGSSGFNTGFAFPETLTAMVQAARAGDVARMRQIYTRFLPLIVFEQQPGVAIRRRSCACVGHRRQSSPTPGAAIQPGGRSAPPALRSGAARGGHHPASDCVTRGELLLLWA